MTDTEQGCPRFVFELRLCKDLVDAFWFDDLVALICVRLIKLDQRRIIGLKSFHFIYEFSR